MILPDINFFNPSYVIDETKFKTEIWFNQRLWSTINVMTVVEFHGESCDNSIDCYSLENTLKGFFDISQNNS